MAGGAAASIRQLAKEAKSLPRQWAEAGAKTITKAATKRLTADTGGDRQLSHAPGKLSVQSKVQGETIVIATIAPAKRGIARWTWLEDGTRAHTVGGRYKGARHPGTRGKGTWSKAVVPEVRALVRDAHRRFDRMMGH